MRPELIEFAKILIEQVRDSAIQSADSNLDPNTKGPVVERWRAAGVVPATAHAVIPDIVDATIFRVLDAIDQGLLHLVYVSQDGSRMDLTEESEDGLGGWFIGSDGWRAKYSKERFVDDFADVGSLSWLLSPPTDADKT